MWCIFPFNIQEINKKDTMLNTKYRWCKYTSLNENCNQRQEQTQNNEKYELKEINFY